MPHPPAGLVLVVVSGLVGHQQLWSCLKLDPKYFFCSVKHQATERANVIIEGGLLEGPGIKPRACIWYITVRVVVLVLQLKAGISGI